MVWVKDLLAAVVEDRPDLEPIIKPAVYAPMHLNALQILDRFQNTRSHMVLIVDSFEIVQGLVTIKDILQAIIGELPYPLWVEETGIIRRDDGSMLLDGRLPMRKLKKVMKIPSLTDKKQGASKNVAEFVLNSLEHIPFSGESFAWEGYRFEVVDMDGPVIDKILV